MLVGLLDDSDLLVADARLHAPSVTDQGLVEDVATLMVEEHISRVPIVDAAGKVVGIVTRGDLVAAMGR